LVFQMISSRDLVFQMAKHILVGGSLVPVLRQVRSPESWLCPTSS
jgi:hypothetical protein